MKKFIYGVVFSLTLYAAFAFGWPSVNIDTTSMDAGTDSPAVARAQIKQMADNVNNVKDSRGAANGVASLDASSKVPVAQLPTIPATQGGTGQTTYTQGDILVAGAGNTLTKLSPGANNTVLTSNGPGVAPTYRSASTSGSITSSGLTQNSGKLLGRTTADVGGVEEISVSGNLKLTGGVLSSALNIEVISTVGSGTWTPPDGVTKILVAVVGGGGGGGSDGLSNTGGNGGLGGMAIAYINNISGPVSYTIGSGGTVNGAGSNSTFGAYITATGGGAGSPTGGTGAAGTSSVSGVFLPLYTAGTVAENLPFIGASRSLRARGSGGAAVAWASGSNSPGAQGQGDSSISNNGAGGVGGVIVIMY